MGSVKHNIIKCNTLFLIPKYFQKVRTYNQKTNPVTPLSDVTLDKQKLQKNEDMQYLFGKLHEILVYIMEFSKIY